MTKFITYISEVSEGLMNTKATDIDGSNLDTDCAYSSWIDYTKQVEKRKGIVFFCGNGASATIAEHLSHDSFQNGDLMTYTVSETSHITAISNDLSYEDVFAYRIGKMCDKGDMLITISSSGNSPNVLKAINTAREKEMYIVTLSGMSEANRSRKLGNLNFYVPLDTYGLVENAHATLMHCWLDLYMEKYKGGRH